MVFILVFPDLKAALHVHGISAFQKFRAGGAEAVEGHDSKPGGSLLRIAIAILPSLVHGNGEVHDMIVIVDTLHLGRPAQVPDNLHIVQTKHVIRTIRWPFWPGYGSTTAQLADGSWLSEPG